MWPFATLVWPFATHRTVHAALYLLSKLCVLWAGSLLCMSFTVLHTAAKARVKGEL